MESNVSYHDLECKKCGSLYKLRKMKLAARDKDKIICEVCGDILIAWNGAECYSEELITRKTNHL